MATKGDTYERLRQMIFNGTIGEGETLIEREIGECLGVSRVPVREALLRLATEGLVINSPGRGLVSRTYNFQDIAELYLFREAMDGMASRLFAKRADEGEVGYLKLVFEYMKTHIDEKYTRAWIEKDREFHSVIVKGCRNLRVAQALEIVYGECFFLRSKYVSRTHESLSDDERKDLAQLVLSEHQRILDAIVSGDPDAAERTARESDQAAQQRMLERYAAVPGEQEVE